jgi:hypothetical protein
VPDPAVVIAMRGFKQGLLVREAAQMQEMARRWIGVERSLEGRMEALAADLAARESVSEAQLYRMGRYKRLLAQAQSEVGGYAEFMDGVVTQGQGEVARLGLEHSQRSIQLSYWPRVRVAFDRLPVEAVENMAGLAGNGRPVGELLKLRMVRDGDGAPLPGVWERLTQRLIDGTAQGWNPRKTARLMRDDLAGGLQKALVISRSEQLRVYREVHRSQYEASGVVKGQKRLTAHDGRVCAACIADEGTVYPLTAILSDHPQGRCTAVPVVRDMPEVEWLSGEDWLRAQDEGTQRGILGGGRFEAWSEGKFELGDVVKHTHDDVWGAGLVPKPLGELVG